MKTKKTLLLFFTVYILILINGCVNVDQTTVIREDGSGNIKLDYWTHTASLRLGNTVGGMVFYEPELKHRFTSEFFEVKKASRDTVAADSTTHIRLNIDFKDFNKISEVPGFERVKGEWKKENENMVFKYTVNRDTTLPKTMSLDEYVLKFKFEFPGEVISTNGTKDGSVVTWNRTVADLKEDIVMTATIKPKSKLCGIFGFEFPVIVLFGMAILMFRRSYKG